MMLTVADEDDFRVHFGEPIETREGTHSSKLAGWTMALHLGDRLIFENEGRYALVATEEKPPDPMMTVIMVALSAVVFLLWAGSRLRARS